MTHSLFAKPIRSLGQACMILSASAWMFAAAAQTPFVGVKSDVLHVYKQANPGSTVVWELDQGYPLHVEQRQGDWLQVSDFDGTLGWTQAAWTEPAPSHRVVKVAVANLRDGPGTQNKIVGKLQKYDLVQVIHQANGWDQIRTPTGQQGWVARSLTWGS